MGSLPCGLDPSGIGLYASGMYQCQPAETGTSEGYRREEWEGLEQLMLWGEEAWTDCGSKA